MKNKIFFILFIFALSTGWLPAGNPAMTNAYCGTAQIIDSCHADFEFTYVPTTPIYVQFTDNSTGIYNSWNWDFGDGNTSAEQNPVHAYPIAGEYEVCLTISYNDSTVYCQDLICKIIIIPDSVNCEAIYTYSVNPYNPLELNFYDHSLGNITHWVWDFGDGSVSQEQNPVHVYEQPNEYLVCLNVYNSDTLEDCFHFICKTIDLQNTIICESNFVVSADSSSQIMNHFFFTDLSSGSPDKWLWNFGDGHTSQEQHPEHIYAEAGNYQICLETRNSMFPDCNDIYCSNIQTPDYHHLGGLAFIGDNPINNPYPEGDTGIAILYRKSPDNRYIAVDTNTFHNLGYFWFTNMMELPYLIRISLSEGSEHFQQSIPSYYPNEMLWGDANNFILDEDMYEMNISLMQAIGADAGIGRISGRVIDDDQMLSAELRNDFHDIPVILSDENHVPREWTSTDLNGDFVFDNLALGTYYLYADAIGVFSLPEKVILTDDINAIDTVTIGMYSTAPLAIEEPVESPLSILNTYPNPADNEITITLFADSERIVKLNIMNMTGQAVSSMQKAVVKGTNTIQMNTENLSSGIYLINLTWDGQRQVVSRKFVKN